MRRILPLLQQLPNRLPTGRLPQSTHKAVVAQTPRDILQSPQMVAWSILWRNQQEENEHRLAALEITGGSQAGDHFPDHSILAVGRQFRDDRLAYHKVGHAHTLPPNSPAPAVARELAQIIPQGFLQGLGHRLSRWLAAGGGDPGFFPCTGSIDAPACPSPGRRLPGCRY